MTGGSGNLIALVQGCFGPNAPESTGSTGDKPYFGRIFTLLYHNG